MAFEMFLLMVRPTDSTECHPICKTCTGQSSTECTSCDSLELLSLNGTTCSCQAGSYGVPLRSFQGCFNSEIRGQIWGPGKWIYVDSHATDAEECASLCKNQGYLFFGLEASTSSTFECSCLSAATVNSNTLQANRTPDPQCSAVRSYQGLWGMLSGGAYYRIAIYSVGADHVKCSLCHQTCKTCLGPKPSECTSCGGLLLLHNGTECVEQCPEGTVQSSLASECVRTTSPTRWGGSGANETSCSVGSDFVIARNGVTHMKIISSTGTTELYGPLRLGSRGGTLLECNVSTRGTFRFTSDDALGDRVECCVKESIAGKYVWKSVKFVD